MKKEDKSIAGHGKTDAHSRVTGVGRKHETTCSACSARALRRVGGGYGKKKMDGRVMTITDAKTYYSSIYILS